MKSRILVVATVAVSLAYVACQQRGDKNNRNSTDSAGFDTMTTDTVTRDHTSTDTSYNTMSGPMRDDAEFLAMAYGDGLFEIEAAKLAQKNASSNEVKTLAKTIETDHMKANDQLSALAGKSNVTLPVALTDNKQSTYNELAAVTGKEFDKEYIKEMVKCHEDAIDAFEKKSKNANNAEIQNFAVKTIPVLTAHKTKAEVIKEMNKM
ncbi:hypothetical protein D3C80_433490 [compost metagenome]